ncbi:hypothetical protein JW835_07385 [bacterium]|nr:hypothetical protein [bacterium]
MRRNLILLLTFISICSLSYAQMVGSPVGNQGQGQWSISCSGSFMNQQVGYETAHSQRWMLKSTYGIVPWMDFTAMIGAADLRLDSPRETIEDYQDKHRFAVGAGLTFTPKHEAPGKPWAVFGGGHFLRFPSKGEFYETVSGQDVIYLHREYRMEYDWREYLIFGGISYRLRNLRFYGCGAGWGISRLEKQMEYHYENIENKEFIKERNGEFQSELWTGALAGIEVVFPKNGYTLSFEGLFYNEKNFILMVGIGQVGILHGDW